MIRETSFVADFITSEVLHLATSAVSVPGLKFTDRVTSFGLDPRSDFRFADLAGCDFSNCDLRGFDFTGADLRCCVGIAVNWDLTTILDEASLGNTFFATELNTKQEDQFADWEKTYEIVSGEHEADGLNRIIALFRRNNDDSRGKAFYIVKKLFFNTNSAVVRNNMLYCVGAYGKSSSQTREFLNYLIAKHSADKRVMRSAVRVLADLYFQDDFAKETFFICLASDDEGVRHSAIRGLLKSKELHQFSGRFCTAMKKEKSLLNRRLFLSGFCKYFDLLHYVSTGQEVLDYAEYQSKENIRNVASNVATVNMRKAVKSMAGSQHYPMKITLRAIDEELSGVIYVLAGLRKLGLPISYEE